MAKGYWVAHVDVSNPDGYRAYMEANGEVFRKWGAKFVVRAGRSEVVEGELRSRHVVMEFKDYATALACYRSPEYQQVAALRRPHSSADIIVIEGYDGAQP